MSSSPIFYLTHYRVINKYDPVIILTFDCLRAYLDTNKVYNQGVFKGEEIIEECFEFENAAEDVRVHCNNALASTVSSCSVEVIESKQERIIESSFDELNSFTRGSTTKNITEEEEKSENSIGISALKILQAIAQRFQGTIQEKHTFLSLIIDHF